MVYGGCVSNNDDFLEFFNFKLHENKNQLFFLIICIDRSVG